MTQRLRVTLGALVLLACPSLHAAEQSPFIPVAFQVGMGSLIRPNSDVLVFGPYLAYSPLLDFGTLGLRAEVSGGHFMGAAGTSISTYGWGAYFRFPIALTWAKGTRNVGYAVTLNAFHLEIGGGMDRWTNASAWKGQLSLNLAIIFHHYIERLTMGTMYVFGQPDQAVFRIGMGFAIP